MLFFDPLYLLFLAPGMILAMWAQWKVHSAYAEAKQIAARSGYNGAQTAHEVMRAGGVHGVEIEPVDGVLTDHYSSTEKTLRLSPDNFSGHSLAALGIAAHEAGHAIQDARNYGPLVIRNALVPVAQFGSGAAWIIFILGFILHSFGLIMVGIVAFSAVVLFQLVNLPVEFDASRRAKIALVEGGLIAPDEKEYVDKVLNAAAMTYVAATLTSILTLLYFLMRSGLLGGSRN